LHGVPFSNISSSSFRTPEASQNKVEKQRHLCREVRRKPCCARRCWRRRGTGRGRVASYGSRAQLVAGDLGEVFAVVEGAAVCAGSGRCLYEWLVAVEEFVLGVVVVVLGGGE